MKSDSWVDYVRLHADCYLVANRPAEADVEMTACLPPMPHGGSLLMPRNPRVLESNSLLEWTALRRSGLFYVVGFVLQVNML